MKRYTSLEEISDGNLYQSNDMVKADCNGCRGCHACCTGMGNSILLDPYDAYQLSQGLHTTFASLIGNRVELNVVDGVILPNIMMQKEGDACGFLNEEGRCSVHSFRPGICRLFPLGRVYENGSFSYFLQTGECKKPKTKIKVSKWLAVNPLKQYEGFVLKWHYFINELEEKCQKDDENARSLNMKMLKEFYLTPIEKREDIFTYFEEKMENFNR